jgi:membrane fusion protein (multidrug efflux system)
VRRVVGKGLPTYDCKLHDTSEINRPVPMLRTLAIVAALTSFVGAHAAPPGGGIPVKTALARHERVVETASAVGQLIANETVTIRPEIDARVTALHFSEGQRVAKGALLVSLDDAEERARIASSEAELELARRRLARSEDLVAKNFLSRQALDQDNAAVQAAEARAAELRARAAKFRLHAPFAGKVGLKRVSPGAYVGKGADIVELADTATLKLDVAVPQVYIPRLRAGLPVRVSVDAYPGETFHGTVYAHEASLDPASRTIRVRARVPNRDGRLAPGMFARVSADLGARANSVVIPEQALTPKGGEVMVFKVVNGQAQPAKVVTGARMPGKVEIIEGLAAGDEVVIEGQIKLKPGMPVMRVVGSGE